MSELRWNPTLDEWVVTATHRQDRTFFPPPDYDPLAPTKPGGFPTEIPASAYEIVVFENKFPSFRPEPPEPSVEGSMLYPVRPASGVCEVVCYTSAAEAELALMDPSKLRELVRVWADRFKALGSRPYVDYVYIFENKGKEIGVTLPHPHGQIYAYPFVPPIPAKEVAAARGYTARTGRNLYDDIIERETRDGHRIVWRNASFVCVVPFYARYPYEVHIIATKPHASLSQMGISELNDLAEALRVIGQKYIALWNKSLPYIMLMHQAPTTGADYDEYRFHVEFYPPYRTPDKLKYLAGSEAGAGVFINDTHAEDTAKILRDTDPLQS